MGVSGSERVSGPMSDQSRERGPTEEGEAFRLGLWGMFRQAPFRASYLNHSPTYTILHSSLQLTITLF